MTLTANEPTVPPADAPSGRGPRRQSISDIGAYLDGLPDDARVGLRALEDLLVGVTQRPAQVETAALVLSRDEYVDVTYPWEPPP